MLKSRNFTVLALLLVLALFLGACAAQVPAEQPAEPDAVPAEPAAEEPAPEPTEVPQQEEGPVTLTWGMWGSPEEIETHQKVADAYMAANPEVTVELWAQPWGDYFTKLQTLWAAGDAENIPDVLFLFPVPSYAADGVLENLDPYIAESGMDLSDYWPGTLDTTSLDGSVYGFARDIGMEVLYYNKDHFDAAGLDYPDETWTWDDLRAAAEALTVKTAAGRVERYGLGMEGGKYGQFLISNGGGLFDDTFSPTECWYDKPESIAGFEFIAGMMNDEIAMRDANLNQAGGDSAVFQSEQVSMIVQNASRVPGFNAAGMNYDVAPVPTAPGGARATGAAGAAWTMSALSDNKEAAWDYLQFLQSVDGGLSIYPASGEAFPPLRSVAESEVWLGNDVLPEGRAAWLVQAEGASAQTNGFFDEWNDINGTIVGPALTAIWAGEAAPADILPGVCEDINAVLGAAAEAAGEGVAPSEPMEPATLTWGMWGSPEEIETHQKVADAYMAANPEVTVELWAQPWGDYFTKLQTLWAAGDAENIPDVLFLFPVPSYAADGVLENLDPYIAESGMDLGDYWPGTLDTTSLDGSVYGFARDIGMEVLYYNKDHFDAAGLDYPDETWTWDDLRAAAEALTVKTAAGRVERYGLGMEGGKYGQFLISNGGGLFDDTFSPTECWYDKPESIAGFEFIAGMMNDEIAMRDANLNQAGGDSAVFQSEQVSMIVQNASRVPGFNAAGMNYDVAPVPTAPGGARATGAAGAAWTMSALSDNKEAAWDYLQFLQSVDGGLSIYPASGEAFPPLRSVAESEVWLGNDVLPEGRAAWLVQAEGASAQTNGFFDEWNDINGTIVGPALTAIWAGEAAPADILPGVCEDINAVLAQ